MHAPCMHRGRWTWLAAAVLVLPAAMFAGANTLKYGLGVDGPYDWLGPLTDPPRSTTDLVTAIVLIGPAIGLAIALWPVVRMRFGHAEHEVSATLTVRLRWANLAVAAVALGVLAILFGHILAENAACWFGSDPYC